LALFVQQPNDQFNRASSMKVISFLAILGGCIRLGVSQDMGQCSFTVGIEGLPNDENVSATLKSITSAFVHGDHIVHPSVIASVKGSNATMFDMYQCSYEVLEDEAGAEMDPAGPYPGVYAYALCHQQNSIYECATAGFYNNYECASATLCPQGSFGSREFAVDCRNVITEFPNCRITCAEEAGYATGVETCVGGGTDTNTNASNTNTASDTNPSATSWALARATSSPGTIGILSTLLSFVTAKTI
jgi:hypothetical protein